MKKEEITIALTGNPNSGKTTIFNNLTGTRQHVGNWPGVTVEKKVGTVIHNGHRLRVVDLPGTYSLTAYSIEEIVARRFLVDSKPDVVVDIVDASNLERNLYLATQLIEMGVKLILALNMADVAQARGHQIDTWLMWRRQGATRSTQTVWVLCWVCRWFSLSAPRIRGCRIYWIKCWRWLKTGIR